MLPQNFISAIQLFYSVQSLSLHIFRCTACFPHRRFIFPTNSFPLDVALYGTSSIFSSDVMSHNHIFFSNIMFLQRLSAKKYFLCRVFSGYKCLTHVQYNFSSSILIRRVILLWSIFSFEALFLLLIYPS